jgi:nicotinamide riboside kinase
MKIAFVGTSCIGKTSLLEYYKEQFKEDPGVMYAEEAARKFFARFSTADRFGFEAQGKIQQMALRSEQEAQALGARLIFCDRSVLDAVVYVGSQGDHEGAQVLLERVRDWLPTYNRLFLLDPADVDYVIDDIRQEPQATRQLFHGAFVDFFREMGIPYELLKGTLRERCQKVDEVIGEEHRCY